MSAITRLALTYDRFTTAVVVLAVICGIACYRSMPRNEDPGFTVSTAMVTTFFPGASPERVAMLVTDKIEKAVQEIPELDKVRSESRNGVSLVWVDIQERYRNLRPIWDRLRRKMTDVARDLPSGAKGPFVDDEFGDVYGIIVTVSGDDFSYRELKDTADRLKDRFLDLEDAARIELYGVQDERIFVEFKNARLTELGISPRQIVHILESRNIIMPGGSIRTDGEELILEPTGNFETLSDLAETVVRLPGDGSLMYLRDIVDIRRGYVDPPRSLMVSGGHACIGLGLSLRRGGDILRLGRDVRRVIDEVTGDTPWGMDIATICFQPDVVKRKVDEFAGTLLQSIGLVMLVMMIAMGLKMGFLVASMIPVTILASMILMWTLGIGLDQVSLSSLVVALGMLVDNAIVIVESIAVTMADGTSGREAALRSSRELALPLLSSSLTTAAAFLPVYLARSTTGEYTSALFEVLSLTLLCSWVVALTMTPLLCTKLLLQRKPGRRKKPDGRGHSLYRSVLELALGHRKKLLLSTMLVFAAALYGLEKVPFIFFPPRDVNSFVVELDLPPGTSIYRTADTVKAIGRFINDELMVPSRKETFTEDGTTVHHPAETREGGTGSQPGVTGWAAFIGRSAPRFVLTYSPKLATPERATIIVAVNSREAIGTCMSRLERYCFDNFPDLDCSVRRVSNGPSVPAPIEMKISGPCLKRIFPIARRFEDFLRRHQGTKNVRNDWGIRSKKLLVRVNQPRARRAGVTSLDTATALQAGLSGIETTKFRSGEREIPVILRSEASLRENLDRLDSIGIFSASGRAVPLRQVADIELVWQPARIIRLNRKPTVTVLADLTGDWTAAQVAGDFLRWLNDEERARWTNEERFVLGGETAEAEKANRSIMVELPVAAVIIVLLLVGQFNSFRKTAIILVTIPLGLIGVSLGLILMKSYFGFMTLLGIVSLSGIVVNNAIVLLERIELERKQAGTSPYDAVVEASCRRLRPILLTTATTIGGLVPLYLGGGELWEPMAIAIMFGLGFSTLLTLGVVPMLYCLMFRVSVPDVKKVG